MARGVGGGVVGALRVILGADTAQFERGMKRGTSQLDQFAARAFRDSLMNWPSRIAPLVASEIGADQVRLTLVLEKHVRQLLVEISTPETVRSEMAAKLGGEKS